MEYVQGGKTGTARADDFHVLPLPGHPASAPSKAAPLFRKEFDLAAAPGSACITVHSLNYFEVYVNGAKVGRDVLTPAVSNPEHQSFSVTYDVARYLRPGRNCMGLWVGEGWADGMAVRAQLDAEVAGKALPPLPRTIDFTVDYLRSGLPRDAYARARILRSGRRYASVTVEAWQDNRARLFAQGTGHFLMPDPAGDGAA